MPQGQQSKGQGRGELGRGSTALPGIVPRRSSEVMSVRQ